MSTGAWARAWGDSWGLSWGLTYEANQEDLLEYHGGPDTNTPSRSWRDSDDTEHDKSFERYRKALYSPPAQAVKPTAAQAELPQEFKAISQEAIEPVVAQGFPAIDLSAAQADLAEVRLASGQLAAAMQDTLRRQDDEEALILLLLQ